MLKVKIPKIVFMILTSVFCLYLTGLTVADECWNGEGGGPTFTGNHNYPSGWFPEFQYDPNNPDEIDRNSSVEISVIEGFPPYTWEVSGTGFSLSEGATEGLTNTLIADDTACGSAIITVTDKYGAMVSGSLREKNHGHWVCKGAASQFGFGYPCTSVWGPADLIYISGYQKWVVGRGAAPNPATCCTTWPSRPYWGGCYDLGTCPGPPCGDPLDCDGDDCVWGTRASPLFTYYEWQCP
jgi:hypothetical protein